MRKPKPTAERLREVLLYDPESGSLTWRARPKTGRKGSAARFNGRPAGTLSKALGYRFVCVDGYVQQSHRAIWQLVTGAVAGGQIDHINGDRADNRWANLRDVTKHQNMHNQRKPHKSNKLGLLGVHRNQLRFEAGIRVNGKRVYIGLYKTAEEAHAAYIDAKRRLHPTGTL